MASISMRASALRPWQWVMAGGLCAGALDIVYAMLYWRLAADVPPMRIFQSIAAGLIGKAQAFDGGGATALLGAALHLSIASTMAWTYFVVSARLTQLTQRPILYGAAYGLVLYAVMNYIVVPLSAIGPSKDAGPTSWVVLSLLVHMVVGVLCALAAARARHGARASMQARPF